MSETEISQVQVETAQKLYDECKSWKVSDNLLYEVCSEHPGHHDAPINQIKVTLINRLYSAGVLAERQMAEHISQINELERLILDGDQSAVCSLGKTKFSPTNNFRSFSSKYCHFHNPSKYPIYDKYTRYSLCLPEPSRDNDTWYEQYRSHVRTAIRTTGKDYEFAVMDRFLWLKGLRKAQKVNPEIPLSAGIEKIIRDYPDMWAQLD
jgi:hypothetical protein